jgi:hypothetical protein
MALNVYLGDKTQQNRGGMLPRLAPMQTIIALPVIRD